jgi:hypothetical protein
MKTKYSKKTAYINGAVENAKNRRLGLLLLCLRQLVSARAVGVLEAMVAHGPVYVAHVEAMNTIVVIGYLPCGKKVTVKVVIK